MLPSQKSAAAIASAVELRENITAGWIPT